MMVRRIIDMNLRQIACVLALGIVVAGCFYDVEDEIYPKVCTTDGVTYSHTILPIMQRECYTCHDALTQDGSVNLEGYDALFEWVANGKVLSSIRHESAYPMPEDREKLDSCTIAKIEMWINSGALNN